MEIYTIGHSTRSLDEFLEILKNFNIELVIDVRKFPSSKKFPWFNKENLEKALKKEKIKYIHFSELGGYRKEGYEAFSKSNEFRNAVEKLLKTINEKKAVILCCEFKWWKCHRRYIADCLAKMEHKVIHIFTKEKIQEHKSSKEIEKRMKAKIKCDKITT
jgi:uncharacterized protein (DUF488 family)